MLYRSHYLDWYNAAHAPENPTNPMSETSNKKADAYQVNKATYQRWKDIATGFARTKYNAPKQTKEDGYFNPKDGEKWPFLKDRFLHGK
jgi:hypothetical protein